MIQKLVVLFYADNRLLASPWPDRIQEAVDFLKVVFNWVGMRENVKKTVGMVCQPCRTSVR